MITSNTSLAFNLTQFNHTSIACPSSFLPPEANATVQDMLNYCAASSSEYSFSSKTIGNWTKKGFEYVETVMDQVFYKHKGESRNFPNDAGSSFGNWEFKIGNITHTDINFVAPINSSINFNYVKHQ